MHIQNLVDFYGITAMLERAQGDRESADKLIATLEGMIEDADDERLLTLARRRAARASADGRGSRTSSDWRGDGCVAARGARAAGCGEARIASLAMARR
jgi:hypothetical protein